MCRTKFQWFLKHGHWFWTECGFFIWILKDFLHCFNFNLFWALPVSPFKWGSNWFYSKLILTCPFSCWPNEGSVFSSISGVPPLSESSPSLQLQWWLYQLTPFLSAGCCMELPRKRRAWTFASNSLCVSMGMSVFVETFSPVLVPWSEQMLHMLKEGLMNFPSKVEI